MIRTIRNGALIGTAAGAGVAIILITLSCFSPFPWYMNGTIERLTFRLCPLFILGFANGMGSMANVVMITILGNAILYGIAGGIIATMVSLYKRLLA
jgi:hypothetical protein